MLPELDELAIKVTRVRELI